MATTTSTTYLNLLYEQLLGRSADSGGLAYYRDLLDANYLTRAQVLDQFIHSNEYNPVTQQIANLYQAAFSRLPDYGGLMFWKTIHDNGSSLSQIANQFINGAEFKAKYGTPTTNTEWVETLYQSALGRPADEEGKAAWTANLNKGTAPADMLKTLAMSEEFNSKYGNGTLITTLYSQLLQRAPTSAETPDPAASLPTLLNQLVEATNGVQLPTRPTLKADYTTLTESSANNGTLITNTVTLTLYKAKFAGDPGASLGKVTLPGGLTGTLTKLSDTVAQLVLEGAATKHASTDNTTLQIKMADADFNGIKAAQVTGNTLIIPVKFVDILAEESGGILSLTGMPLSTISIDLSKNTLTVGTTSITPLTGSMANAVSVDASKLLINSKAKMTNAIALTGDDQANVFIGSTFGDSFTGGGGNDTAFLGPGKDTIIFAKDAALNGVDTIYGYKWGKGGDVLNFSAFLNKTGTSMVPGTIPATNTTPTTWINGDVIIVNGEGLNSAASVAALFGTAAPLINPTTTAKIVVITAGIIGDASIWYITNQNLPTSITADEIQLVGTLKDVHNLSLVAFDTANVA